MAPNPNILLIHADGTDRSFNPDIQEHLGSPCVIPEANFGQIFDSTNFSLKVDQILAL